MTFGASFGRVISPTFQPKSIASGGAWWLAGGINPANCVAAYQAKGAASYALSKVNLANPGTYNCTEGNEPDWDAASGWKFNGINNFLKTGVIPVNNQSWSAFIRYSNGTLGASTTPFGAYLGANYFYFSPRTSTRIYANGNYVTVNTAGETAATAGISGNQGYYNGTADGTTIGTSLSNFVEIYIGARNAAGTADRFMASYTICLAIYNTVLTSTQVGLLTTAMNAL